MGNKFKLGSNNWFKTYSEYDKRELEKIQKESFIPKISENSKKLGNKKRLKTVGAKDVFESLHDENMSLK